MNHYHKPLENHAWTCYQRSWTSFSSKSNKLTACTDAGSYYITTFCKKYRIRCSIEIFHCFPCTIITIVKVGHESNVYFLRTVLYVLLCKLRIGTAVTFWTCIWEVLGSNTSRDTAYLDWSFRGFPQSLVRRYLDSISIAHNRFLPNPFRFSIHQSYHLALYGLLVDIDNNKITHKNCAECIIL
jgi:hypothetical protein